MIRETLLAFLLLTLPHQGMAGDNPFLEGIEPVPISEEDWNALKELASNSRTGIQVLLRDQNKLTAAAGNSTQFELTKVLVMNSKLKRGRIEILLRIALNQAFELTFGVPSEDGKKISRKGVFSERTYSELTKTIFMDSLSLAEAFYVDARMAVNENYLQHIPLIPFVLARAKLIDRWKMHVMTASEEHDFWNATFRHMFNLLTLEDALMQNVFGEEILDFEQLGHSDALISKKRSEWQRLTAQITEKAEKGGLLPFDRRSTK